MADKKTQLLEESSVRKFMKIAGNGKLADDFVKKSLLKEDGTGRGRIFDPHGDDPRHDNLNEFQPPDLNGKETNPQKRNADGGKDKLGDIRESEVTEEGEQLQEEDVTEEGQDLEEEVQEEGAEVQEEGSATGKLTPTGPGKDIAGGKGMSGAGKKTVGKKIQYEGQGNAKGKLTPTGPGKDIAGGKGMSGAGKKTVGKKIQYEGEVQEEGEQLQEMGLGGDDEMGAGPPMGGDSPMGGEPDGDEPMGGGGDVAGLVQAIADAITQHTGVNVSVEGGEGGGPEAPPTDEPATEAPPDETMQQEAGMVGYKTEDPKARRMPSGAMQEGKKVPAKTSVKAPAKKEQMQALVETITNKVLAKLGAAAKKKLADGKKAPVKK